MIPDSPIHFIHKCVAYSKSSDCSNFNSFKIKMMYNRIWLAYKAELQWRCVLFWGTVYLRSLKLTAVKMLDDTQWQYAKVRDRYRLNSRILLQISHMAWVSFHGVQDMSVKIVESGTTGDIFREVVCGIMENRTSPLFFFFFVMDNPSIHKESAVKERFKTSKR